MSLVGLDFNSTRARAVQGAATRSLAQVQLEPGRAELPLTIRLDERKLGIGSAGVALLRVRPHVVCHDFLAALGTTQEWKHGRHTLDADAALRLALETIARQIGRTVGVAVTLPSYLDEGQLARFYKIAAEAGLPLAGSLPASLAAVLNSPLATDPACDPGMFLVVESDSHALTWTIVERSSGLLRLRLVQPASDLGRWPWIRRLLDALAMRCVRLCRRDPLETAQTEQSLFEQLLGILDQTTPGLRQLAIQGQGWSQAMLLHSEELAGFVVPLLRQVLVDLDSVLGTLEAVAPLSGIVITHSAGGLPGLVPALRLRIQARPPQPAPATHGDEADWGDLLMQAASAPEDNAIVQQADALACVAHEMAVRIHRGDFPRGHLESVALPGAGQATPDSGPARLSFRGRDHFLCKSSFTLGRDPTCDMVFESELYPHVSTRHCDIVFDRRAYVLYDRSRHGTLLNDRPVQQQAGLHSGDWIRLGPRGPVLRFLGVPADPKNPSTTTWRG